MHAVAMAQQFVRGEELAPTERPRSVEGLQGSTNGVGEPESYGAPPFVTRGTHASGASRPRWRVHARSRRRTGCAGRHEHRRCPNWDA